MNGDTLCRWSQPLGGRHDGGCDEPQRDGSRFCERHAAILAVSGAATKGKTPGERPIAGPVDAAPVITRHIEPRTQAATRAAAEIAAERSAGLLADAVDAIARYVAAAPHHPVSRAELRDALPTLSTYRMRRALPAAVASGRIVVVGHEGSVAARGYYPATATANNTNIAEAA
jgi:hypothetical protein